MYSSSFETTLVRIETDDALVGWGEAQAPVLPEASAAIITHLLGPMLEGEPLPAPEEWWDVMYEAMRVRGHHGGFYVDAMAGIDLALWDLDGQRAGRAASRLLSDTPRARLPVYISGLVGARVDQKVAFAREHVARGARAFKLFLDASTDDLLRTLDDLRAGLPAEIVLLVDALWRLSLEDACRFAEALAQRHVGWLEAPLIPEDVAGHGELARRSPVRLAIGECLRTVFEVQPFLDAGAVHVLQPDLGRTGLSGARRIGALAARAGVALAPHVSVGLGPQIAAAVHFSAAEPRVEWLEVNPAVYATAQQFQTTSWTWDAEGIGVPDRPGLGCVVDDVALAAVMSGSRGGAR